MILKLKILVLAIILILFLKPIGSMAGGDDTAICQENAYIALDQLLIFSSKSGDDFFLKRKKWISLISDLSNKNKLNLDEIKFYLFLSFIAEENVLTHTKELISEKFVTQFENQPNGFLEVLREHRFLIPPTQAAIKRHFILYNESGRSSKFIEKYKDLIVERLGKDIGTKFIDSISM